MGFGAGHIFDMIRRVRQNEALTASRRSKKSQELSRIKRKTFLKFPKASEKKIHSVRKKYRSKNNAFFTFIVLLLIIIFVGLALFSLYVFS